MTGIGTTVHGGFAEYCVVAASQAYRFSDGISYDAAAMTEPVSCCLHGIDLCEIQCGSTVAVIANPYKKEKLLTICDKSFLLEPMSFNTIVF